MNIPVQFMQPEGEFLVPGTRQTVNSELVRRAVGRLPLCDRGEVLHYMTGGPSPSEEVAEAIRKAIVEIAERERERRFPSNGKNRSQPIAF